MTWLKYSPLLEVNIPPSSCTVLCLLTLRVLLPLNLSVAFQISTPYICRGGSELHMIVALGTDVPIKFILSNAWMKKIGAVLDYGTNNLIVPLQYDLHNFRLTYHAPQKSVPSPDIRSSHEIALVELPKIEGLL